MALALAGCIFFFFADCSSFAWESSKIGGKKLQPSYRASTVSLT